MNNQVSRHFHTTLTFDAHRSKTQRSSTTRSKSQILKRTSLISSSCDRSVRGPNMCTTCNSNNRGNLASLRDHLPGIYSLVRPACTIRDNHVTSPHFDLDSRRKKKSRGWKIVVDERSTLPFSPGIVSPGFCLLFIHERENLENPSRPLSVGQIRIVLDKWRSLGETRSSIPQGDRRCVSHQSQPTFLRRVTQKENSSRRLERARQRGES